MDQRTREIIKMALLFFASNREDFVQGQQEGQDAEDGNAEQFCVNGVETTEPTEEEVEAALAEFQDVL